jgi:hypothetical protein
VFSKTSVILSSLSLKKVIGADGGGSAVRYGTFLFCYLLSCFQKHLLLSRISLPPVLDTATMNYIPILSCICTHSSKRTNPTIVTNPAYSTDPAICAAMRDAGGVKFGEERLSHAYKELLFPKAASTRCQTLSYPSPRSKNRC